jgi:hypothetical protein
MIEAKKRKKKKEKKKTNGQGHYSGTKQGKRTQNKWGILPKLGYVNHTRNRKKNYNKGKRVKSEETSHDVLYWEKRKAKKK